MAKGYPVVSKYDHAPFYINGIIPWTLSRADVVQVSPLTYVIKGEPGHDLAGGTVVRFDELRQEWTL